MLTQLPEMRLISLGDGCIWRISVARSERSMDKWHWSISGICIGEVSWHPQVTGVCWSHISRVHRHAAKDVRDKESLFP